MEITKRHIEIMRMIAGIILVVGIFVLIILMVVFSNIQIEKMMTDDNIKCLDFCFNGKSFNMSWVCNC